MLEVEFEEDKKDLHASESKYKIPGKSIQGWVYKKLPGKYTGKRNFLIAIIIILLLSSVLLLFLTHYNIKYKERDLFFEKFNNKD